MFVYNIKKKLNTINRLNIMNIFLSLSGANDRVSNSFSGRCNINCIVIIIVLSY